MCSLYYLTIFLELDLPCLQYHNILNSNPRVMTHIVLADSFQYITLQVTPLRLTSLSSLHSSVDKTFSATHGMEEEFCRCEASQIGILHKTPALRPIVILDEVGERAVLETKGDTFPLHILLPHHCNNLQDETERFGYICFRLIF